MANPKVLADGSIRYRKRGWEPPPPLEGYERDPGDPWHFIPKWLPCVYRGQDKGRKSCGIIYIFHVCNNEECQHFNHELKVLTCTGCKMRKPAE